MLIGVKSRKTFRKSNFVYSWFPNMNECFKDSVLMACEDDCQKDALVMYV